MPKKYTSEEAFREYSNRLQYAKDYREAYGIIQDSFSCLALTNEQVRELQALAWKNSQEARNGRVVMRVHVKGNGVIEVADRKEADGVRLAMREYANLLIDGHIKKAEGKRVMVMFHGKQFSILCCKVEGFE